MSCMPANTETILVPVHRRLPHRRSYWLDPIVVWDTKACRQAGRTRCKCLVSLFFDRWGLDRVEM